MKCIVICNGPSVNLFTTTKLNLDEFDIIVVNRWKHIIDELHIHKNPNYVVVGKNSLGYNLKYIKTYPDTEFHCIDLPKDKPKNCRLLRFGKAKCYGQEIDFTGSLWWSGVYAIQLALKKEYDEIHVFGFTCSNGCDYKDKMVRSPIPKWNLQRIHRFFSELQKSGLNQKIKLYESFEHHPFKKYFTQDGFISQNAV